MNNWLLWLIIGIIPAMGGILALLNPFAATITAQTLAGWFFLVTGVVEIFAAFQRKGWGQRIWALVLALAFVGLGVTLLYNPLAGILSLTLVAALMFLANGIAKVFFAFSVRSTASFWPILVSGALSVVLALMVFSNFPQSARVLLGVLLGVELLSSGAALIAFAIHIRKNEPQLAPA